ncbi:tail fiber assembly protein [Serratia liquefaciens]|uniref:tail fiber assembly protein n=1 Tax=Serratia liquefaciens TaxID=614 RepID=UPI001E5235A5|nr:tail fiber assembly protein [Serratia liquefaciens]
MSNFKFSPKTNSFYPESLLEYYEEAGTLPDDLVDVSDEAYSIFSGQPPEGKVRGSKKGKPAWVNIPPLTKEQLQQQAEIQKQSDMDKTNNIIAPLERAVRLGLATKEEQSALTEWETYSVLLSRIDTSEAPNIDWPNPPSL